MKTGLVREAGGFGDIICVGAAARACKQEWPGEEVLAFVPDCFVRIAEHLEGIDRVISLGSLGDIQRQRRRRDFPLDLIRYPYLKVLREFPDVRMVSLWCPGYSYESKKLGPLCFNRNQLFAMSTGVSESLYLQATPKWNCRSDEIEEAERILSAAGIQDNECPLIAIQVRGTCPCRSLTPALQTYLLTALRDKGKVLYFDCISPCLELPEGVSPLIGLSLPIVAAIVSHCTVAVTVDSMLLHLAAALDIPTVGVFGPTDGANTVRTYSHHVAIESLRGLCKCKTPCNYATRKGWNRECRVRGCERMLGIAPYPILQVVDTVLFTKSLLQPTKIREESNV